jgi:hypothetical protein
VSFDRDERKETRSSGLGASLNASLKRASLSVTDSYQAKADAERRRTLQLSQQQQDAIAEEGETDEEEEGND